MSTSLAERGVDAMVAVTSEQMDLVKRTVANGATADELKLYLYDCARQGVHPLDKLLHFTKRGGKYTPVTSIDLMRTRAADTGEYAGSDDAVFVGTSAELSASVTVWRMVQGQRCSFSATARWAEYYPGDQSGTMWRKMPHTMLAKCAEALALRKGFPRQLAGLYATEELDQAERTEAPRVESASALPPDSFVNATSGELVSERPAAPDGYVYIDHAKLTNNGWFEFIVGEKTLSTKLAKIGDPGMQAFQNGVPVKLKIGKCGNPTRFPNAFYLDGLEVWKPEPVFDEPVEPVSAADIAF